MPNFTEGEWIVVEHDSRNVDDENGTVNFGCSYEIQMSGKPWVSIASFIGNESDARLMAQSKKMYEVIKEINDAHFELVQLPDSMREKIEAILSEIDKED